MNGLTYGEDYLAAAALKAIADVVFCWWSHPISETLAGAYPMVKAIAYVALTGISRRNAQIG